MRRISVWAVALALLVLPAAATADIVDVTVQDLVWRASTTGDTYTVSNAINTSNGAFDEDSQTYLTGLGPAGGPLVGAALWPWSAAHNGGSLTNDPTVPAYFGGIATYNRRKYYNGTAWTDLPPDDSGATGVDGIPNGHEITAAFYGLQSFHVADHGSSGEVTVYQEAAGKRRIMLQFNDLDGDGNVSFDVFYTGGSFEIHHQTPENYGQDDETDVRFERVDLKDGTGATNPAIDDWATATDDSYGGTPLLTGDLKSRATVAIPGVGNVPYTAVTTVTIGLGDGVNSSPNYNSALGGIVQTGANPKPALIEVTGGAMSSFVNPFGNPSNQPDHLPARDGFIFMSDLYLNSFNIITNPGVINWGTTFIDPISQPLSAHVEYGDRSEIQMELQTPDPATVAFFAPALFGFLGYSVRRRRKRG